MEVRDNRIEYEEKLLEYMTKGEQAIMEKRTVKNDRFVNRKE